MPLERNLILAPLRGVTIRCFRRIAASELAAAHFTEAFTPFITANPGVNPLKDRELRGETAAPQGAPQLHLTPQFIGKNPSALRECLHRIKDAGFTTADLNCGCPFPMVRNKGRGSGLLRTPDILRSLLDVGCTEMGDKNFSIKTRLGIERPDEFAALLPSLNQYPLRFITVHARTARQMYTGSCNWTAYNNLKKLTSIPLVPNGDLSLNTPGDHIMIGRAFIRSLGEKENAADFIARYAAASLEELTSPHAVLGRMKELLAYWQDLPRWKKVWRIAKLAHNLDDFLRATTL